MKKVMFVTLIALMSCMLVLSVSALPVRRDVFSGDGQAQIILILQVIHIVLTMGKRSRIPLIVLQRKMP